MAGSKTHRNQTRRPHTSSSSRRAAQNPTPLAFGYEAMADTHWRNWAALLHANLIVSESSQAIAAQQLTLMRESARSFAALIEDTVRRPGDVESHIDRSTDYARRALDAVRDLTEQANRSNVEMFKLVQQRLSDMLHDTRVIEAETRASAGRMAAE